MLDKKIFSCVSCNGASGRPRHLGVIVLTILLLDFSLTVKAAPNECVIRTGVP